MAIAHMDLKFRLAKRNNTNNVSISIKKKFNFMFMGKMHTHTQVLKNTTLRYKCNKELINFRTWQSQKCESSGHAHQHHSNLDTTNASKWKDPSLFSSISGHRITIPGDNTGYDLQTNNRQRQRW